MIQFMKIITHSSKETIGLGERLGKRLQGGEVVCLFGDLGAGKTTLVKGIAKSLEITKRLLSPTYIIVRHYPINHKTAKTLYHIDLYRIKNVAETMDLGLKDWLSDKSAIVVIEWSERLEYLLPSDKIDIHFQYIDEYTREITIENT